MWPSLFDMMGGSGDMSSGMPGVPGISVGAAPPGLPGLPAGGAAPTLSDLTGALSQSAPMGTTQPTQPGQPSFADILKTVAATLNPPGQQQQQPAPQQQQPGQQPATPNLSRPVNVAQLASIAGSRGKLGL